MGAARIPSFLEQRLERQHFRRVARRWQDRHFFPKRDPAPGDIELHSNDYLRLADHPDIVEARVRALQGGANDALMSAVFLTGDAPQHGFEQRMARHLGSEAAILCQSGYAANVGLLQTIAEPATPVYLDRIAHMSLWEGARRAEAPLVAFAHNDVADLERKLAECGPGVVVVDSVYSTNGSVCPLADVAEAARRRDSIVVVDESHSLGTHGPHGAGMVSELGLEDVVLFRTASLSKAFSGRGGILACPACFVDYFRIQSYPAIFSSTLLPYEVAGFLETLTVVRRDDWRRERLHRNASLLRGGLEQLGFDVSESESQILALEGGSEYRTFLLRDLLAERGVVGAAFMAPATSWNAALVRLSVHCGLDDEQIDRVLDACAELRDAL